MGERRKPTVAKNQVRVTSPVLVLASYVLTIAPLGITWARVQEQI